jgi:hypothetical protein
MPYRTLGDAVELARRGRGSLVGSVVTADAAVARQVVLGVAPFHGRLLVLDRTSAKESTGHGSPLPNLVHGGPGRAGGGEEMGGARGVTKHKEEDYQPFWNLLSQHTTQLPNLLSLDKEKLKTVIDILFKHLRQNNHRNDMTLTDDAYDFLFNYPYKENLRDLRNLLDQPIISSKENIIGKEFYLKLNNSKIKSLDFQNEEDLDLRKGVQAFERQKILLANKIFSGNQIRMAKALGISRGSLQYKIKQLEL